MVSRSTSQARVDVESLMTTSRVINAVIVKSIASVDADLTVPQLRVLVILASYDGASLSRVAEDLGVNPSNASRTCDQLVRRALVDRDVDAGDRRKVSLRLAPSGTRLLDRVMDRRRALLEDIVLEMTPADRRSLMAATDLFNAAAQRLGTSGVSYGPVSPPPVPWLG